MLSTGKGSAFSFLFSTLQAFYLPLVIFFFFSLTLLVSNLIFITAESLKQFTWSTSDMKIDSCDPLLLPGKQKRGAVRACVRVSVCVREGVNDA